MKFRLYCRVVDGSAALGRYAPCGELYHAGPVGDFGVSFPEGLAGEVEDRMGPVEIEIEIYGTVRVVLWELLSAGVDEHGVPDVMNGPRHNRN